MNLQGLHLGQAARIIIRTTPILLVRLGAYLVFWFIALVYFLIVGGIAYLVGQAIPLVGFILFIVAFGGVVPLYKFAYHYVFYLLKAAHLAVISELLVEGKLPDGVNQLSWGKNQVQERFGEVNAMLVVDEIVHAVVRRFTRTVYRMASWLPSDSLRQIVAIANRVVRLATTYVDEAIMARAFWTRGSVWSVAQDGVVLYAMCWKPMLKNAIILMLLSYVPFVAAVILLAAPIGFLIALISPTLAGWSVLLILLLAFLVKVAIGDSFAMAAIITTYQREIEGMVPDPAMMARLEQVSDKFKVLRERAAAEVSAMTNSSPTKTTSPSLES